MSWLISQRIKYQKLNRFLKLGFPGLGETFQEWKLLCLGFGKDTPNLLLQILKEEPEPIHYPTILALRVFGYKGGSYELEEQNFKIEYRFKPPDQDNILIIEPKYQLNMEEYPLTLEDEETTLMWAAHFGSPILAKHAIAARCDVNAQNSKGETALMIAQKCHESGKDRSEIISILRCAGAK